MINAISSVSQFIYLFLLFIYLFIYLCFDFLPLFSFSALNCKHPFFPDNVLQTKTQISLRRRADQSLGCPYGDAVDQYAMPTVGHVKTAQTSLGTHL